MPAVLHIQWSAESPFCALRHPYNKRFVDWLSGGIRPVSYRRYDHDTRQWSVHVNRLPVVVSMGRRYFDHVDYSSLPEELQIRIVKGIEDARGSRPSFAPVESSAAGPHAVLFVLPTAPWEVIEAAYKALAFKTHPDRGGSREDFERVQKAFEKLKSVRKG